MFCKNKKFFYTGDYVIYDIYKLLSYSIDDYNENVIFNKKGFYEKEIFWKLTVYDKQKFEDELFLIYTYTVNTINYYVYFHVK
jgi:hypothetical protein